MATAQKTWIRGTLLAAAAVCILAPFVSVCVLLLGKVVGIRAIADWGFLLLLWEFYAAPVLCIICLLVLLISLRCKEAVPATYAVFGLLLNLFGLWAFISPTVAS